MLFRSLRYSFFLVSFGHLAAGRIFNWNTCGLFIKDLSEPSTYISYDSRSTIIRAVEIKQTIPQTFIIQTNNKSKVDLVPNWFPTMKYDCFVHLHIHNGENLFSTIPWDFGIYKNTNVVYSRGIFVIMTLNNPKTMMYTIDDFVSQYKLQHRVFIIRYFLEVTQYKTRMFHNRMQFFCAWCSDTPFVSIKSPVNILNANLLTFKSQWGVNTHYWPLGANDDYDLQNIHDCYKKDLIEYFGEDGSKCLVVQSFYQLIGHSTGLNMSVQAFSLWTNRVPRMIIFSPLDEDEVNSIPVLLKFFNKGLVYCIYDDLSYKRLTDMWIRNVGSEVWILLLLTVIGIIVISILTDATRNSKNLLGLFFYNCWNVFRCVCKQGVTHITTLCVILELMFCILQAAYENFVTVQMVVSVVQKPFASINELYNQNYTFFVPMNESTAVWLQENYNYTFKYWDGVGGDMADFSTVKKYFWNKKNEEKFAVLDIFPTVDFTNVVRQFTGHLHVCYKITPQEGPFHPEPLYADFNSAIAETLATGVKFLQGGGFVDLLEKVESYSQTLHRRSTIRELQASDQDWIALKEKENQSLLQENMISFENCSTVFCLMLTMLLISAVLLVLEKLATQAAFIIALSYFR